jgi:hypothetical protein
MRKAQSQTCGRRYASPPGEARRPTDEFNRRRAGKNARLSLGRAHECRRSLEGHNLEQDSAAVAPQGSGDTRFQTSIPLAGVGCVALTDHLRAVTWPTKFHPHLSEKYDGTTNPSEFLQVYITAITAAGGDTTVMVAYFHVALSGSARTWLMNQASGSIHSSEELCARFMANFASAYQQHGVEAHLHAVRQEPGEPLRAFISRFTKVRRTILRISDVSIITAFRQGCVTKKCWRSWPRATWTTSPHSSLWLINVPGPLRAVPGTRRRKLGAPRQAVRVPLPRAMAKRKRETRAATVGYDKLPPKSSLLRLGARMSATSVRGPRKATTTHARCTPTAATTPPTAGRLSNS